MSVDTSNQMAVKNYQPVLILRNISTLFKKAEDLRLLEYVDRHKLSGEEEHAFRKHKSTGIALINFTEY